MRTRKNSVRFALALSTLLLCACASQPAQRNECYRLLPPNADLLQALPPPGYFSQEGEKILRQGQTSARGTAPSTSAPTSSSPSAEDSSDTPAPEHR